MGAEVCLNNLPRRVSGVPIYDVAAALFAVIDWFFGSLVGFIGEITTMLDFFSFPDVAFIRLFFVSALALLALSNVAKIVAESEIIQTLNELKRIV